MTDRDITVFFYGLFMDVGLLRSKGIEPGNVQRATLDGFGLRIGERATLWPDENSKAYGLVMTLSQRDVDSLYSAPDLAAYRAETITVRLEDGSSTSAVCYNLAKAPSGEPNPVYVEKLGKLAARVGFPSGYVDRIAGN
ncbi:MAG TPA: gamma-glutamylcyclotransferase [Gemmatimonadaceae bacterium]|nr:gamma-glutamylcyclotransferase [Gemmatimonadaceae bacterium]